MASTVSKLKITTSSEIVLPDGKTIGELYEPAMKIKSRKKARPYLEMLVDRCVRVWGLSRADAVQQELANLRYYSGYFGMDVRNRVAKFFRAEDISV
jgi:hypothetical protein